jgi:hypothetical protein
LGLRLGKDVLFCFPRPLLAFSPLGLLTGKKDVLFTSAFLAYMTDTILALFRYFILNVVFTAPINRARV